MFKTIIFSLKKSKVLSKIAKQKSSNSQIRSMDFNNISNILKDQNIKKKNDSRLLNALFNLLEKDDLTMQLMRDKNKSFNDLILIIQKLEISGAGQIVKGNYVPIASIAFIDTLKILLEYWDGENFRVNDFDSHNSNLFMANKMLSSF